MNDATDILEPSELREYRAKSREWLETNMEHLKRRSDGSYISPDEPEITTKRVAEARLLQGQIFEAGFAGIPYPKAYGGQGLSLDHERVFLEEATGFNMPTRVFGVSLNILGATLVAFGSEDQKRRHLRQMLIGEELWLQFLSEPSGGSDLAGLLTRATRDGDVYVLNGQKTWSTGAAYSDFAMCPVRTRWDVPKHKGISVLIVDLRAEGVEIRPIRQIDGGAEFCEEFFTDVVVPAENRVGAENEGWRVARGLLEIEHAWVGRSGGSSPRPKGVEDLIGLARQRGLDADDGVRRQIAAVYAEEQVGARAAVRVIRAIELGQLNQGYAGNLKIATATLNQRRAELGLSLAGSRGVAWHGKDPEADSWSRRYLTSRSSSIAGGTNEVQRNNVGERALGLPREPTSGRDIPFNEQLHN